MRSVVATSVAFGTVCIWPVPSEKNGVTRHSGNMMCTRSALATEASEYGPSTCVSESSAARFWVRLKEPYADIASAPPNEPYMIPDSQRRFA